MILVPVVAIPRWSLYCEGMRFAAARDFRYEAGAYNPKAWRSQIFDMLVGWVEECSFHNGEVLF
jgi:hypothetical protein